MKKKLMFYQVMFAVAFILGGMSIIFNCSSTSGSDGGGDTGSGDASPFCKKDTDCENGFTCQSGVCKPKQQGCSNNNQCDGGCCNNSTCGSCALPDGGSGQCKTNDDCKPDKICKNGGCEAPGQCINNDECPVNLVCNTNSKKCECTDNASCDGWGFQRPYCDPVTKECREEQTCDDCDPNCKQCSDGTCSLQENKCCGDGDCTQEGSYCNMDTYECIVHQCSDTCQNDDECISWCSAEFGDMGYCSSGTCLKADCKVDADCDSQCAVPGRNTCNADYTCTCWTPKPICAECTDDSQCDDSQSPPHKCFTDPFNPAKRYCTHACTDKSQCADTGRLIPFCFTISQMCGC